MVFPETKLLTGKNIDIHALFEFATCVPAVGN
jgi:hypothetical protein